MTGLRLGRQRVSACRTMIGACRGRMGGPHGVTRLQVKCVMNRKVVKEFWILQLLENWQRTLGAERSAWTAMLSRMVDPQTLQAHAGCSVEAA